MLVIGKVGSGPNIHDTRLTPNEQITHITLWTIQAAPLLVGADMAPFDKFTTDLMTNHEVMEVNSDVLGRGGSRVLQDHWLEVWARPLADSSKAHGVLRRQLRPCEVGHESKSSYRLFVASRLGPVFGLRPWSDFRAF
jgi:alpha-galactosidase